ncbi:hypothetical protein HYPSUDRAFT_275162 [Hypholoma sublateritium FD-334 SS-4]|uniref:Uncharacterized protein n=1 Tax=Hypholoma sublateritium (strain FD-334 SS-4) TaxID=945553 RepID=A0A0D2MR19_HYPSF|nr:hypothetical protein HYPSUDRAFT_275162 [Hypholoma sublateritium FD-334 SS-4]
MSDYRACPTSARPLSAITIAPHTHSQWSAPPMPAALAFMGNLHAYGHHVCRGSLAVVYCAALPCSTASERCPCHCPVTLGAPTPYFLCIAISNAYAYTSAHARRRPAVRRPIYLTARARRCSVRTVRASGVASRYICALTLRASARGRGSIAGPSYRAADCVCVYSARVRRLTVFRC